MLWRVRLWCLFYDRLGHIAVKRHLRFGLVSCRLQYTRSPIDVIEADTGMGGELLRQYLGGYHTSLHMKIVTNLS